jgi:hypothetical protein
VISHQKQYFVKSHSDSTHKYSEVEIKKMLEFVIDNVFVVGGGQVFQQSVGIHGYELCPFVSGPVFVFI